MNQIDDKSEGARDVHHSDAPMQLHVKFVDIGGGRLHIRKWAADRQFDGAARYLYVGNGAPLGPDDFDEQFAPEQLPQALRGIAENLFCECDRHVLAEMVNIILTAAKVIEAQGMAARSGETGTGSTEGNSPVAASHAPDCNIHYGNLCNCHHQGGHNEGTH